MELEMNTNRRRFPQENNNPRFRRASKATLLVGPHLGALWYGLGKRIGTRTCCPARDCRNRSRPRTRKQRARTKAQTREGCFMPQKQTIRRVRKSARKKNSPATLAGRFVRREIRHIRAGRHGARSIQQLIAIGLSKARKAGIRLPGGRKKVSRARRPNSRFRQGDHERPPLPCATSRAPRPRICGRSCARAARQAAPGALACAGAPPVSPLGRAKPGLKPQQPI